MFLQRRKYFSIVLAMIIISSIFLAACGTSETSTQVEPNQEPKSEVEKRVIKHELGETEIKGTPQRIVALEFSYVDALAALGIAPVGVADDNDPNRLIAPVREKIGDYTSVGTRKQPNLEVISSLKPDLIIADLKRHKEIYDQLQQIAPTIVLSSLSADYQGIMNGFTVISDAVGKKEEGQKILEEYNQKIEVLKANIPADESRTVMPAVVSGEGFYAHSALAYTGSLLESVGLKNAISENNGLEQVNQYNQLTLEQVVKFNPDILFLIKEGGDKSVVDEWKNNPLWQDINAVKNGQVYEVDRAIWAWSRGLISSETILEDTIKNLYTE
ncbi:MAG: Fe(3+) dicitrate ABC transporter substrate-binding protein [Tepidibacillus sp.]